MENPRTYHSVFAELVIVCNSQNQDIGAWAEEDHLSFRRGLRCSCCKVDHQCIGLLVVIVFKLHVTVGCFLLRPDADVMNNVWEFALFLNTACAKVFS